MIEVLLLAAATKVAEKLAADSIADAAKRYVGEFKGWRDKIKDEEAARLAVERVLTEQAEFPPKKALRVFLEPSPAQQGGEGSRIESEQEVRIALRIWNRADFPVRLAKLKGVVAIADGEVKAEYEFERPDQFEVDRRGDARIACKATLRRGAESPRYSAGSVIASAQVEVLAMGPWIDEPHNTHRFDVRPVWFPVAKQVLDEVAAIDENDVRIAIEHWVNEQTADAVNRFAYSRLLEPLDIAELERELGAPAGSAARFLPEYLTRAGWVIKQQGKKTWKVEPSPTLAFRIQTGT